MKILRKMTKLKKKKFSKRKKNQKKNYKKSLLVVNQILQRRKKKRVKCMITRTRKRMLFRILKRITLWRIRIIKSKRISR